MKLFFLILSALSTTCALYTFEELRNLTVASTFLQLDFIPPCIKNCSEKYLNALESFYINEGPRRILTVMCDDWPTVRQCFQNTCSNKEYLLADQLFKGINYSCHEHNAFEAVFPCMVEYADLEHTCGACNIYQSALSLAKSPEMYEIIREEKSGFRAFELAGSLCGNISCSLPCIRDQINKHCDNSGAKFVELFARPLNHFKTSFIQKQLAGQLPSKCKYLISNQGFHEIMFDKQFEEDVRKYIKERRLELLYVNNEESEEENFKEDTTSLRKFLSVAMKPFYVGFIAFVLLLNILALIITVIWCVTKRENVLRGDRKKMRRIPFISQRKKRTTE